ncbi:antibiotic biosynthesis monooxygenase family protein [Archangium sp.]|uniref:antibiotic biosynthesis monooxygenase family protein n=1 Tax=Archangium sp. TaxID=1872627 RepID=UPI00389A0F52
MTVAPRMIVTINRFRTSAEEAERLEASFRERSRRVDPYEGFLGLEVMRSFEPEPEFLLVTRWRDRECLKAYFQSEDFKATKAASARQDATFSMYEVVAQ